MLWRGPKKLLLRKRKYREIKSGAKRLIIPIERLLWNDGAQAAKQPGRLAITCCLKPDIFILVEIGHFHFRLTHTILTS